MNARRLVRCQHSAAAMPGAPPHDRAHLRIHYPARYDGTDDQRLSGSLPVEDPPANGFPVVLIIPGVNVGPEAYGWLAVHLAARGFVAVTWSWVDDLFGGQEGLTAGVDIDAIRPETAGTRPASTAVAPILAHLGSLGGPLAGHLNLARVALGGHSAGGTMALQSASSAWFEGCRAAFAYGAHTKAATALGWDEGSIVELAHRTPVLLMGGTADGVIAGSADRYGADGAHHDPIERTFDEAVPVTGSSVLAFLDGGNHFSFTHPPDTATGRGFLEDPSEPEGIRPFLGDLIAAFLDIHLTEKADAPERLDHLLDHPLIAHSRRR
jgi:dienelactone hydrolase